MNECYDETTHMYHGKMIRLAKPMLMNHTALDVGGSTVLGRGTLTGDEYNRVPLHKGSAGRWFGEVRWFSSWFVQ